MNALKDLCARYSCPVVIADRFFARTGIVKDIARCAGAEIIFSDISPNPDVSEVDRCAALLRKCKADVIVALGGGSAIDLAKAASITVEHIREYHGTGKLVPQAHIPVIAVPTTSGTGSEVTCVAVLSDRANGTKAPINSDSFYPAAAVIDPELTISVPPDVTASTGIDVLCHAVEGYWSRGHQPICDAVAVHAAGLVLEWLPIAYDEPHNGEAREKLAEASVMAGLAFTLPKTTGSHACSFPLTSIYGIPHGEACGLTLDYFARINAADPRTQELSRLLGFAGADDLADAVYALKMRVRLRTDIADLGLDEMQLAALAKASRHPNLDNNPIEITDDMLLSMYKYLAKGSN